jgi:hypothetical protein
VWATPDVVAPQVSPGFGMYAAAGMTSVRLIAQLDNNVPKFIISAPKSTRVFNGLLFDVNRTYSEAFRIIVTNRGGTGPSCC